MYHITRTRTTTRRTIARTAALLLFSGLVGPTPARGQSQPPVTEQVTAGVAPGGREGIEGRHGFSFWTGVSFDSRGPLGAVPGRKFFLAAVRYHLALFRVGPVRFRYVADAIPVAIVTNNPDADAFAFASDTVLRVGPGPRGAVYGFGASPIGFEIAPLSTGAVEIVAGGTGGFLSFARPVPFRNARRFNYTFELSAAARFLVRSHFAVAVGYRLHHLSNAGTGRINPGLDANLFYVELAPR